MSASEARTALLDGLSGAGLGLDIVGTNEYAEPDVATPYLRADVLFAEPDNTEYGSNFQDRGFLQVTVCYPVNDGLNDLMATVDSLRTTFQRGATFTSGSTRVLVHLTPNVFPGQVDGAHFAVPVRIPFH